MSKIGKYIRKKRHKDYIEKRVVELGNKIYEEACLYGTVDSYTRKMFLKYNNRLKSLVDE